MGLRYLTVSDIIISTGTLVRGGSLYYWTFIYGMLGIGRSVRVRTVQSKVVIKLNVVLGGRNGKYYNV